MEWYRKRTLGGILDEAARRWGPREALVFESRRWTYAELNAETDRVAAGPDRRSASSPARTSRSG